MNNYSIPIKYAYIKQQIPTRLCFKCTECEEMILIDITDLKKNIKKYYDPVKFICWMMYCPICNKETKHTRVPKEDSHA